MFEYQVPPLSSDGQGIVIILLFSGLLIGVWLIGYFMQKQAKTQHEAIETQHEFSGNLKRAVDELTIAVYGLKQFNETFLPRMDERLNRHSEKIKEIDTRLTGIETEHKLLSCKTPVKRKNEKIF